MAEALKRWKRTMEWRENESINELLFEPQPYFKLIKHHYPHFFHQAVSPGFYLYIEQPGRATLTQLFKTHPEVTIDTLVKHYVFVTEYLWRVIDRNGGTRRERSAGEDGDVNGSVATDNNNSETKTKQDETVMGEDTKSSQITSPSEKGGESSHPQRFPAEDMSAGIADEYSNSQLISIFDVSGARLAELTGPILKLFQKCTETIQAHYPERSFRLFVIHAPWWFSTAWALLSPFLDRRTKQKVKVLTGNAEAQKKQLIADVGVDKLPEMYGGTASHLRSQCGPEVLESERAAIQGEAKTPEGGHDRTSNRDSWMQCPSDATEEERGLWEYVERLNNLHGVVDVPPTSGLSQS